MLVVNIHFVDKVKMGYYDSNRVSKEKRSAIFKIAGSPVIFKDRNHVHKFFETNTLLSNDDKWCSGLKKNNVLTVFKTDIIEYDIYKQNPKLWN